MPDDPLIQHLQRCTVRLVAGGGSGTGFFVAPNLILTCAHVVKAVKEKPIAVFWQSQEQTCTAAIAEVFEDTNLDLALLEIAAGAIGDHPWITWDTSPPRLGNTLYSYGYPKDYPNGDSASFEFEEGSIGKSGFPLYKLKGGQVDYGLSGAPLLNLHTGKVCGIINLSRSVTSDLGGRAVPFTLILDKLPQLLHQPSYRASIPLINPFQPLAGRVDQPHLFFECKPIIHRIFETLNSGSSVALIGEREVGKSSILWAIGQQAETHLYTPRQPIYINLQLIDSDEDFYSEFCEKARIPDVRGRHFNRAVTQQRFLLLLDEVERITDNSFSRRVRDVLRGLAEGGNAPLRLVLAASTSLDRLFPDSYEEGQVSPLVGICIEEQLKSWDERTITAFINSRLATTPIRFTDDEIAQLIQESRGNPRRLMQLCHRIFAQYVELGI